MPRSGIESDRARPAAIKNSAIREVTSYTDPSNDQSLHATSKITQCRYVSSTSNISNPLICLYYIFSSFRTP